VCVLTHTTAKYTGGLLSAQEASVDWEEWCVTLCEGSAGETEIGIKPADFSGSFGRFLLARSLKKERSSLYLNLNIFSTISL
jgi:hypothetical protein